MKRILAPSLLSADFLNLQKEIKILKNSKIKWLHLDIMDGHFVPNLTFGPKLVTSIKSQNTKMKLDCHLMVSQPENWITPFADAGADCITIHVEAAKSIKTLLYKIKKTGCLAGVSINPGTPVKKIEELLEIVDLVLVMSVHPGFGGQKFIKDSVNKIKQIKKLQVGKNFLIQVDGGVDLQNVLQLKKVGVQVFVSGSAVFSGNIKNNIAKFNRKLNP